MGENQFEQNVNDEKLSYTRVEIIRKSSQYVWKYFPAENWINTRAGLRSAKLKLYNWYHQAKITQTTSASK